MFSPEQSFPCYVELDSCGPGLVIHTRCLPKGMSCLTAEVSNFSSLS